MTKNQKITTSTDKSAKENIKREPKSSGLYRNAMTGEIVAVATRGWGSDKSDKVELRVSAQEKRLLQGASRQSNQSLSAFVLTSSIERARSVLSEQTNFVMSEQEWQCFNEALDAPAQPKKRLSRLMKEPGYGE